MDDGVKVMYDIKCVCVNCMRVCMYVCMYSMYVLIKCV